MEWVPIPAGFNVCPDDFKAKGGGVVLGFLVNFKKSKVDSVRQSEGWWCRSRVPGTSGKSRFSASKSGYGQGKGSSRVEGGCCTVCASKFYGPSGYGAPPFSNQVMLCKMQVQVDSCVHRKLQHLRLRRRAWKVTYYYEKIIYTITRHDRRLRFRFFFFP